MLQTLKLWARSIRRDIVVLWLAARDPRVPWLAKAVSAAVAAYALSPIDLIPDFIPILGYLDDLVIVPLGILLAIKLIPTEVLAELRAEAVDRSLPTSIVGLCLIVCLWLATAGWLLWAVWPSTPK